MKREKRILPSDSTHSRLEQRSFVPGTDLPPSSYLDCLFTRKTLNPVPD